MIFALRKFAGLTLTTFQKLSGGLTARTERSLAEKAGHLELLAGGKRDSKAAEGMRKAKKDKKGGP